MPSMAAIASADRGRCIPITLPGAMSARARAFADYFRALAQVGVGQLEIPVGQGEGLRVL